MPSKNVQYQAMYYGEREEGVTKDYLQSLDPKSPEFYDVASIVAKKTAGLRQEEGKIPYELFLASVEMLGLSPCIEVIIFDKDDNLYLKRREVRENATSDEEESWGGKLHLPGTTIFPAERFEMNLYGLFEKEVVGGVEGSERRRVLARLYRESEVVGVGMHDEPARKTDGLKVYVKIIIDDPKILQEGYEIVNTGNLEQVIDDHKGPVMRILNHRRGPLFFDSRPHANDHDL